MTGFHRRRPRHRAGQELPATRTGSTPSRRCPRKCCAGWQVWNGPFPFPGLTIVDGSGVVPQDASYPGLIVMATRPIPGTRLFEQALARQVALQWTACATGADELSDPGVAQGPAAYSELRYSTTKYGRTSLVDAPPAPLAVQGPQQRVLSQALLLRRRVERRRSAPTRSNAATSSASTRPTNSSRAGLLLLRPKNADSAGPCSTA